MCAVQSSFHVTSLLNDLRVLGSVDLCSVEHVPPLAYYYLCM